MRRADADIVRLTGVSLGADFTLAHRALCARAIRRRAAAETLRLTGAGSPVRRVLPSSDSSAAIALEMRSLSPRSSASTVWIVMGRNSTTAPYLCSISTGGSVLICYFIPRGYQSAALSL